MGHLEFKIFTDESLVYGKDYSFSSISKEIEKIKGVKSVAEHQNTPITKTDWDNSCRGIGTNII